MAISAKNSDFVQMQNIKNVLLKYKDAKIDATLQNAVLLECKAFYNQMLINNEMDVLLVQSVTRQLWADVKRGV